MAIFQTAYDFGNMSVSKLIDNAFLLAGVEPALIDDQKIETALFHINLILTQWVNDKVLQFNEIIVPVQLDNNVPSYELPIEVYDIYNVSLTQCYRQTNGAAFSTGGGTARNAFDGNIDSVCTQTEPNKHLGISLVDEQIVTFFGIASGSTSEYQLLFEGSFDGETWIPLYRMDRPQLFSGLPTSQKTVWFNLNTPGYYSYYRVSNLGNIPLSIREFYLETYANSRAVDGISRSDYQNLSAKYVSSQVSLYSLVKSNTNIFINVYGLPTNVSPNQVQGNSTGNYNFILARGAKFPYDVRYLKYPLDLQRRFIPSLFFKLAFVLAMYYKPEKAESIMGIYNAYFKTASGTDNDKGGLLFQVPQNTGI